MYFSEKAFPLLISSIQENSQLAIIPVKLQLQVGWAIGRQGVRGLQETPFVLVNDLTDYLRCGNINIGDPSQSNFLPIMAGWNYMLRIYLPQASYFDGSWKSPAIEPVK